MRVPKPENVFRPKSGQTAGYASHQLESTDPLIDSGEELRPEEAEARQEILAIFADNPQAARAILAGQPSSWVDFVDNWDQPC